MVFGNRKGGSSSARARRASQGHARRKGRLFASQGGSAPYKGGKKRVKRTWLW